MRKFLALLPIILSTATQAATVTEAEAFGTDSNGTFATAQVIGAGSFTQPAPAGVMLPGPTATIQGSAGVFGAANRTLDFDIYRFTPAGSGIPVTIDVDGGAGIVVALYVTNGGPKLTMFSLLSTPADTGSSTPEAFVGPYFTAVGDLYIVVTSAGSPFLTGTAVPWARPDGGTGGFAVGNNQLEPGPAPAWNVPLNALDSSYQTNYTIHITAGSVPEPSSICLALAGLALLGSRFRGRTAR